MSTKPPKPPGSRRGGLPPVEHRFPPGTSGNPGGRPKKQATLRDIAADLLLEKTFVEAVGREVTLGEHLMRRAITRAGADLQDLLRFVRWLEGDQPAPVAGYESELLEDAAADDQEIVQAAIERALRRQGLADPAKPKRGRTRKTEPADDDHG